MLDFGFYNMDCMEGMKEFPDGYFDLAIVDPPYGINAPNMNMGQNLNRKDVSWHQSESTANRLRKKYKSKERLNHGCGKLSNRALNSMGREWDMEPPSDEYFKELFRVSKNQVIWGGNYFDLPPTRGILVWDKRQPWDNFSQAELAWTSFDVPAKVFSFSNRGGANAEQKIHPTQKPIELYHYVLSKYAEPGDKILDTHVGSASSLIACYNMGYDFVGFEINEDYYQDAKQRLDETMQQIRMDI